MSLGWLATALLVELVLATVLLLPFGLLLLVVIATTGDLLQASSVDALVLLGFLDWPLLVVLLSVADLQTLGAFLG